MKPVSNQTKLNQSCGLPELQDDRLRASSTPPFLTTERIFIGEMQSNDKCFACILPQQPAFFFLTATPLEIRKHLERKVRLLLKSTKQMLVLGSLPKVQGKIRLCPDFFLNLFYSLGWIEMIKLLLC